MTPITLQGGSIVVRDGKIGTEQNCCCNTESGCCCIDGVPDTTKKSQFECESAGGRWIADRLCSEPDPCRCDAGCPGLDDCLFTLVFNYTNASVTEVDNEPLTFYFINPPQPGNPNGPAADFDCFVEAYWQDRPQELGGDIAIALNFGYDVNCIPILTHTIITFDADCNDPDVVEECPEVVITVDCNPLP